MVFFTPHDLLMAARFFHSADITDLIEATTGDDEAPDAPEEGGQPVVAWDTARAPRE